MSAVVTVELWVLALVGLAVVGLVGGVAWRLARRSLEMRDRRMQLALQASRAAVFEYSPKQGDFLFAQDFSEVTAGFDPSELPTIDEGYDWWIERVHEEDAELFAAELDRLAEGGKRESRLELRIRHRSGEWLYVDVSLFRSDGDSGPTIVGVLRDVTDARVSDFERRELAAQVAQSNRLEALGKLAGGVAHDFNNLLTVINGNVELARDAESAEELGVLLGEVSDAGEKAGALTRQLLQFSRRQAGPKHPVEINEIVRAVDRILRRLIGSSIQLETVLDPKAGTVLGDRSQLEQVLFNLVTNARDALPDGGKIVIQTRRETSIEGRTEVVLSVRDNGTGMPDAVKNHIFDPFFSTKTREQGSGLGLSTVYGIVKESEGAIQVETELGVGTEFVLRWPHVETPEESESQQVAEELAGRELVLVVEDDASVARFIRTALEQRGYCVVEADNGERALSRLRLEARTISLVISDIVMPRMGGVELAERLRKRQPELPILLVSGFAEGRPDRIQELDVPLLDKPFSRQQLLVAVRRALDGAPKPEETDAGR